MATPALECPYQCDAGRACRDGLLDQHREEAEVVGASAAEHLGDRCPEEARLSRSGCQRARRSIVTAPIVNGRNNPRRHQPLDAVAERVVVVNEDRSSVRQCQNHRVIRVQ